MELNHFIHVLTQYSNAWLGKCSCGELFTGKGHSYPIAIRKHLIDVVEPPKKEVL